MPSMPTMRRRAARKPTWAKSPTKFWMTTAALHTPCMHYFDMVVKAGASDGELPDAGGCYHRVADPDDSNLAWTQNVGEGEILAEVLWGTCEVCTFHMGDEQWEGIETEMNSAFDENYSSDNEDMQPVPDADVSMSTAGKDVECMQRVVCINILCVEILFVALFWTRINASCNVSSSPKPVSNRFVVATPDLHKY